MSNKGNPLNSLQIFLHTLKYGPAFFKKKPVLKNGRVVPTTTIPLVEFSVIFERANTTLCDTDTVTTLVEEGPTHKLYLMKSADGKTQVSILLNNSPIKLALKS